MRSDPGLWQRFVTAQSAIYAATDIPGLNPALLTDSSEFMLIVNLATDTARFKQVSERMYEMWNSRPHTLIHGDARSDNLFQANDGSCFAFIDWQTLSAGPPGFEICQLVAGTLANLDDYDRVLPEFLPLMHKMLLEASPDWVAQEYTLQMLIEDAKSVIAMCVVGCIGGLTPMFEALVSAPEHPLWQLMNSCWPRFRRCVEHLQIGTFMTTAFEVSPTVDELDAGDESNDDSRGGKGDNNEAAAKRGFPLRPSEVDCASLSKIFGAEVASFEMDTSTVEAGVLADAFRVDVVYADSAAAAEQNKPLSVFLKCTKHIEAVADMSSASNTYSKEIYFYETLRDQVKDHVRVPEVYGLFRDKNDPQCKEFLLVLEALKVPEEWVTYEQFGIGADPMSPSDLESYMTCLASLHACTWAIPVNEEQPGLQQYAMHWYEAA